MSASRRAKFVSRCPRTGCAAAIAIALAAFAIAAEQPAKPAKADKTHWSFVKPVHSAEPPVKDATWARNPIDRFVLAKLEAEGFRPSPEATRERLIRRVALDLTGLPPTPAEVQTFVADKSPDAYDRLVDRLLASPHYGERWARHWLDVARYADSNGYSQDNPRVIWKYRDWVIDAINRDVPFDQFIVEQFAGDLLPSATRDQVVATGFHRNTQINEEGGIDPEQFRVEAVVDRVATSGTGVLGLSLGCAQCHNHKYDPISQREYYQFYAFLNNSDEPVMEFYADPATQTRMAEIDAALAKRDATLDERQAAWEKSLTPAAIDAIPSIHLRGALKTPPAERNDKQKRQLRNTVRDMDAESKALVAERDKLKGKGVTTTTLVMRERTNDPRETHLHIKGDFTRPGDLVSPGTPAVLPPLKPRGSTADRLDLARWMVDKDNPLTARVAVNRMWQQYFGHGIVDTENDFGTQGAPPSHPELLDWLATEFMSRGWSQKAIHRLIVTSATYRQSSNVRPELLTSDPYNKLLARQTRLRLDSEIVRDVSLAASGLLSEKVGGPSVFPPQPDGVTNVGQVPKTWKVSTGEDRYRRGMYTFFFRATPHPLLGAFDSPDGTLACTRRTRSNTPLQALNLLNDEAFVEFAQALASRTWRETQVGKHDDASRIDHAFELCVARKPAADERQVLLKVLESQRESFATDKEGRNALAPKDKLPAGVAPKEFAAWTMVCRVLLNLDETITRE
jgi:hypothetical protein